MDEEVNYDLIIVSMKAYDLIPALDPLVAFCPEPSTILAVQNGIDAEQPLIEQYGAERILSGSLTTPIRKDTANRLIVARQGRGLGLAPTQTGQSIKQWSKLFQDAGVNTVLVPSYQSMKWSKALLNIVGNATSAILNRAPGIIYKSSVLFNLEVSMLREALDVMDTMGLDVVDLPGSPAARLAFGVRRMPPLLLKPILSGMVARGRGGKMPSFHIDLSSGKGKSEVVYHNGAIAEAGRAHGVPTPVNYTLNNLLMKLVHQELDWRDFDGKPKKLLMEVKKHRQIMERGVA